MARALELAALARGKTSPNPMVGAVVVSGGEIVGEGYHQKAGTPHAEVHALNQAGSRARGGDLYVTLEPCCHFGKTPPCTDAIIEAGIARVFAAVQDPNPLVAGKGVQKLKEAGIKVEVGLLEEEARQLNQAFFKYVQTGRPFVTLKAAMSLDGKIATVSGQSQWITGEEARNRVQWLRLEHDAIMTGIGTVLADDPWLTLRLPGEDKKPLRVVVDSNLRIPVEARLVATASQVPTLVVAAENADQKKAEVLRSAGVEVWELPGEEHRVSLKDLMVRLGERGIVSLLLEGGAELNSGALAEGVVDRLVFFVAPKLIGGRLAPGPVGGRGIAELAQAIQLRDLSCQMVGQDLMITGYPERG